MSTIQQSPKRPTIGRTIQSQRGNLDAGFSGTVTTSFGMNYLKDEIAGNEITKKGITTEAECISGSGLVTGDVNTMALLNTNIQSGLQ